MILKFFLILTYSITGAIAAAVPDPEFRQDLVKEALAKAQPYARLSKSIQAVDSLSEHLYREVDGKTSKDLAWTIIQMIKSGKGVGGLRKDTHAHPVMNGEERAVTLRALARATGVLTRNNVLNFLLGENQTDVLPTDERERNHLAKVSAALDAFKEEALNPYQTGVATEKAVRVYLRESPLGDLESQAGDNFLQREVPAYYPATQKEKPLDQMTFEEKAGYYGSLKKAHQRNAEEEQDFAELDIFFTTGVRKLDIWTKDELESLFQAQDPARILELKKSLIKHYLLVTGMEKPGSEGLDFGRKGLKLSVGTLERLYNLLTDLKIPVVMGKSFGRGGNKFILLILFSHKELVSLQNLCLNGNSLTSVEIPKELVNLQNLYLNNNQLISVKIPKELVNLQKLNLHNNSLTSLPASVRELQGTLTLLNLGDNPLLNQGDGETLGIGELQAIFGDRFIFGFSSGQEISTLTFNQVYQELDKQPVRINRGMLAKTQLPHIPVQTEPAGGIMKLWTNVVDGLEFADEAKPGYLSYQVLATDFTVANNDNQSNKDLIARHLLPRLSGFIKTLWELPLAADESRGWQMHDTSVPEMKQTLIYILTNLRDMRDPEQKSMMFMMLVNGLLHCPTGQREGMDTVVLAMHNKIAGGGSLEETVKNLFAIKKDSLFNEKMAPGSNTQNVHIRSFYKNELRYKLGLFTVLPSYEERIGIMGDDPFKRNAAEALRVFYEFFTPDLMVNLLMESTENEEDLKLKAEQRRLEGRLIKGSPMVIMAKNTTRKLKAYKYVVSDPILSNKFKELQKERLEKTDPDYIVLDSFKDFKLEDQQQRLANFSADVKEALASEPEESEEASFTALKKIFDVNVKKVPKLANTPDTEAFDKKTLQSIKAKLKVIQQTERPISIGKILAYLELEEEPAEPEKSNWTDYFTDDPFKPDSEATLTKDGAYRLLLQMGYLEESAPSTAAAAAP